MKRWIHWVDVLRVILCIVCMSVSSVTSEGFAQGVSTDRHLPFLPGQRIGVSQGNNTPPNPDLFSHYGSLSKGVDLTLPGAADRGLPVVAVEDGVVNVVMTGYADDGNDDCGWGNTVIYCNSYLAVLIVVSVQGTFERYSWCLVSMCRLVR